MSDQFICISCWKEFSSTQEELDSRSGKIVCPFCGYVQPAPSSLNPNESRKSVSIGKLENPGSPPSREMAEEIPWSKVASSEYEDPPISEDDERTDRVEIPANILDINPDIIEYEIGFGDEAADEKTPLEELRYTDELSEHLSQDLNEGVILPGDPAAQLAAEVIDWQLKTPSGLTFKFTDPEAMLGWKKKLGTYKKLDVSPDGERWVDFARFVREYEELGDPFKAFILSENLSDADLPPPRPMISDDDPEPEKSAEEITREREEMDRAQGTGPQFTFKVKEQESSGWGRYLFFAILGLGLGAGIVLAVLHLTGVWSPLPLP
jgi:DNA-directed RNA polymerase subunit RPC12/RpoP